jgi:hypothetical protein
MPFQAELQFEDIPSQFHGVEVRIWFSSWMPYLILYALGSYDAFLANTSIVPFIIHNFETKLIKSSESRISFFIN